MNHYSQLKSIYSPNIFFFTTEDENWMHKKQNKIVYEEPINESITFSILDSNDNESNMLIARPSIYSEVLYSSISYWKSTYTVSLEVHLKKIAQINLIEIK